MDQIENSEYVILKDGKKANVLFYLGLIIFLIVMFVFEILLPIFFDDSLLKQFLFNIVFLIFLFISLAISIMSIFASNYYLKRNTRTNPNEAIIFSLIVLILYIIILSIKQF